MWLALILPLCLGRDDFKGTPSPSEQHRFADWSRFRGTIRYQLVSLITITGCSFGLGKLVTLLPGLLSFSPVILTEFPGPRAREHTHPGAHLSLPLLLGESPLSFLSLSLSHLQIRDYDPRLSLNNREKKGLQKESLCK